MRENNRDIINFCSNVKKLMKDYNLDDNEMAMIMKISKETLSIIKNYILPEELSVDAIFSLHKTFRVKPSSLFDTEYQIIQK